MQGSAQVGFTYDVASRRSTLTLPNGIVATYSYDTANQLTAISYANGGTTLGNLTYASDNAGRRTQIGGTLASMTLPAALASCATYDADNRLTNWAGTTLTYDANGNLTGDGSLTYGWDSRGRLASLAGTATASFAYDAMGRRNGRTVNGTATNFLYDGPNAVQELAGATPTANLLTALGIDEVFTRTDSLGARTLVTDALGSTVALTDSSGAVKTNYAYEPYGNTTASGEANGNAVQYTGRESDANGLYYYRARYYRPATARFISEDAIGLAGGVNLYAYVDGNPISLIDPTGEFGIPGAIAGGIIGGISGGLGAAATGGSVWRGALFGAATGAIVGGTGAWIGASLPGQMALRAAAGGISNLLGQMQGIGDPCFKGLNCAAVAGSMVGGALGEVLAPGAWGTSFAGSFASQVGQRVLAGIPGAGVSGTVGLVGNQLGK